MQDPLAIKGFRLWHQQLKDVNFKHTDGRSYHLSEIVDYSTARKPKWWQNIQLFGGMQNTPYNISGTIKYAGERVGYEISIMDGSFTSSDNYRNNYVTTYSIGDATR